MSNAHVAWSNQVINAMAYWRGKTRSEVLTAKYGISEADYERMFKEQNEVCAICKRHQRFQRLAVDHDHKTGKVRGLLCVNCNRGLGRFFDSPIRLRSAADYLEKAGDAK